MGTPVTLVDAGGAPVTLVDAAGDIVAFGTMAAQDADDVAITGGSVAGITDLAVADGGTGSSTAGGARTNLGLGTAAVKNTGTSGDAVPVLNGAATTWANNLTAPRFIADNGSIGVIEFGAGGAIYIYFNGGFIEVAPGTAFDVQSLLRCDSFRIDQAPVAETPTPTHTITISANGVNYKIPCVAA